MKMAWMITAVEAHAEGEGGRVIPGGMPLLRLEASAGIVEVRATCRAGKVERVAFENAPAFAAHLDVPLEVHGHGTVPAGIAWGGMWFVMADAEVFEIDLTS